MSQAHAQHAHSDVELGYDNLTTPTFIEVEEVEVTTDGVMFFESDFIEFDPNVPGDFGTDDPGFVTNSGEGLLVNPGDQIYLSVLDASAHSAFGVGFVNYYNPTTDILEASGRIGLEDNTTATSHLRINGTGIESGDFFQFIDFGDGGGDIHDHILFDLLDDATARWAPMD